MATLKQIKESTYFKLGQPSDSTNYGWTSVVLPKINDVVRRVCNGTIVSLTNQQKYTAGDLAFLRKTTTFDIYKSRNLTANCTAGASTLSIDASDLPSAGALFVGTEIAKYTEKTSTTVTGVTGITLSHTTTERVAYLSAVPQDSSLPFTMYYINKNGERSDIIDYQDIRFPAKFSKYYSILGQSEYIYIKGFTEGRVELIYYIGSTNMTADTDVCIIPDDYIGLVSSIASGELLRENEETEDATTKLVEGYSLLSEMFYYYANMVKPNRVVIRPTPVGFSSLFGGNVKAGYRNTFR